MLKKNAVFAGFKCNRVICDALRVAAKVEPIFVADIQDMAQAIVGITRAGDVVLCMGAGTIGVVPGKVVDLLHKSERTLQEGKGL